MKARVISGFASGIITALGLMVGLQSGTQSQHAVLGGIIILALADAFSDGYGEYLAERTENIQSTWQVWKASLVAFSSVFFCIVQFIIPILFMNLEDALVLCIIYGMILLGIVSGYIAKVQKKKKIHRTIFIYIFAAIMLMVITYLVGNWLAILFS
jgi:VIT1/CCC1 family predicted Fe2+/Mn2+ transporter